MARRTEEIRLENDLWQRAVDEFRRAFKKEDAAFKRYAASLKTSPLKEADKERDKQYAALLAPTAVNQQKFEMELIDSDTVAARTRFTLIGYGKMDLGIVKYHFEVAAGKENFSWK